MNCMEVEKTSTSIDQLVEELFNELGLSKVGAKVYLSLVYLGGKAVVKDIMKHTGLSKTMVYKGLKELEKHGLVLTLATKPRSYMIVSPREIIDKLIRDKMAKLAEKAEFFTATIEAILTSYSSSEPIYSLITGWENIARLLHLLIRTAEKELILFIPYSMIHEYIDDIIDSIERGVYVDVTLSNTMLLSKDSLSKDRALSKITLLRTRPYGSRLLAIIDSRASLLSPIPVPSRSFSAKAVLVDDPEIAFIFTGYYYGRVAASSIISNVNIRLGDTYVFKNIGTAIEYINQALSKGYEVETRIKGYMKDSLKKIEIQGIVYDVVVKPHKGIYSLIVNTGGYIYTVGGYRAFIEDIVAEDIIVKVKDFLMEYIKLMEKK